MTSTKLPPFTVYYENGEEYHVLKNEIFTQGVYYFETDNPRPRIIDAGAHIGLSTLYFKKIYPGAEIVAIEPNPETFRILKKNVFENQLENVELHQVALAAQRSEAEFFLDSSTHKWWSTAGFQPRAWNGTQTTRSIIVPAVPLADFLQQPVDFLKMDIEGAEQEVLFTAGKQLQHVKHFIIEFHPVAKQSLEKILELLDMQGFYLKLWQNGKEVGKGRIKGLVYIEGHR